MRSFLSLTCTCGPFFFSPPPLHPFIHPPRTFPKLCLPIPPRDNDYEGWSHAVPEAICHLENCSKYKNYFEKLEHGRLDYHACGLITSSAINVVLQQKLSKGCRKKARHLNSSKEQCLGGDLTLNNTEINNKSCPMNF